MPKGDCDKQISLHWGNAVLQESWHGREVGITTNISKEYVHVGRDRRVNDNEVDNIALGTFISLKHLSTGKHTNKRRHYPTS